LIPKIIKELKRHNMDIKGLLLEGFVQDKLSLFLKKLFTFPIPRALLIVPISSK
jgi:hypothetical protein